MVTKAFYHTQQSIQYHHTLLIMQQLKSQFFLWEEHYHSYSDVRQDISVIVRSRRIWQQPLDKSEIDDFSLEYMLRFSSLPKKLRIMLRSMIVQICFLRIMWLATTSEAPIPLLLNTGSITLKAKTSSVGRKKMATIEN